MTITGTNLNGATAVKFGTTAATTFSVTGTTKIVAKTKAHAAGTVKISVTTPGGTATSTYFTFVVPGPDHHLVHADERLDSGGTTVTITGTNLNGATAVKFGTTPATTFSVTGTTKIVAKTKAHAAGTVKISVTTPGGTATSTPLHLRRPRPDHHPFTPTSGSTGGGTTVTITGTNLNGATSVKFGTTPAASFTVTGATKIIAETKVARGRHSQDLGHHRRRDGHLESELHVRGAQPRPSPRFTPTSGSTSVGRQ